MREAGEHNLLIRKLDAFIRRYYKNKLYKGLIYSGALLLSFFLLALTLEFFGNFNTTVRTLMVAVYLIFAISIVVYFILFPLLKMQKLGKIISHEEAARIIGKHFADIDDKLLNLIQLQHIAENEDSLLLQASIEQRTKELQPVPFTKAIDLSKNKKYLKYVIAPVLVLILLGIFVPSFVLGPSERLLNPTTYFEKPAPFRFVIENKTLEIPQQEDFTLQVKIEGDHLPNEVFVLMGNARYKMKKEDKLHFSYVFKNVHTDIPFSLFSTDVQSSLFVLKILPKPTLIDFQVQVNYPAYTGKASEVFSNTGDLIVPQGSHIKWNFQTRDVEHLTFFFGDEKQDFQPDENGRLSISHQAMREMKYGFFSSNRYVKSSDSLRFTITPIPDEFPQIAVLEQRDSLLPEQVFFKGQIKDDYGFSKLQFKLTKRNPKKPENDSVYTTTLQLKPGESAQEFYYSTLLTNLQISPGDVIEYYFQVWDNDAVNRPKMAQSRTFSILIPSLDEIDKVSEKNLQQVSQQAEKSLSEIQKMQQEIKDILKKMVDKKELNWQDKKQLEELSKKESQLKQAISEMQQKISESHRLEQQYKDIDESIIQKQKELERLFNELMTDDLKNLFKELENLQKNLDKENLREALENIKKNNENIEKQLDRDIELMKRLDVEKRLDEAISKAHELSAKQKETAEKTTQEKNALEDMKKEQESLNREFQQLKKDLDELQKKNQGLEEPDPLKRNANLEKEIEKAQQDATEKLDKKENRKKAAEKQKEAAEKLEEQAKEMEEMRFDMESEQLAEDADEIRQLLKNLIKISFTQEELMRKGREVYIQDPAYQEVIKGQSRLKDDFKMIEDSLLALAKRQMDVSSVIHKELTSINFQMSKSLENLLTMNQGFYGNSRNTMAQSSQQYAMTSVNNLSLILAESLDKMQDQMRSNSQKKKQNQKSGKGSCNNPGGSGKSKSKPDPKTMKELQEQLNKQLQGLKKSMEQQQKDGKGRKVGANSETNKELARMAAMQERIRQMMQEYSKKVKEESGGKTNGNLDGLIRDMEQTETDLVNKIINEQTLKRQDQIMTRLLEHEKAQKKQEQEEKRESKEGKDTFSGNQNQFFEYNKLKGKEVEMLKKTPASFSPFYQQKVNEYFYQFGN